MYSTHKSTSFYLYIILISLLWNFLLISEIASIVLYILVVIVLFKILNTFFNTYLSLCNRIFLQNFAFFCTISPFFTCFDHLRCCLKWCNYLLLYVRSTTPIFCPIYFGISLITLSVVVYIANASSSFSRFTSFSFFCVSTW